MFKEIFESKKAKIFFGVIIAILAVIEAATDVVRIVSARDVANNLADHAAQIIAAEEMAMADLTTAQYGYCFF